MNRSIKRFQQLSLWCATAGMLLAPVPARGQTGARETTSAIRDVELTEGGYLHGQLVDGAGHGVSSALLTLRQGTQPVVRCATDSQGHFAVVVAPGMYQLHGKDSYQVCRLWASGTAPPVAVKRLLVPASDQRIRAQLSRSQRLLILTGIVLTSGVIGGVIGYNVRDTDPAS